MKQFKALMAAGLVLSLTACSGGNAPAASSGSSKETPETTPETAPAANAEFAPDQLSIVYGETEYEGKTIATAAITNNSNECIVDVHLEYRPASGYSVAEVMHQMFGDDADTSAFYSTNFIITEAIKPGETSHAYGINTYNPETDGALYMTPETMKMLAVSEMSLEVPQDDGTIITKQYQFSEGDFSKASEVASYEAKERWNTWNDVGVDWLQEISGHDYKIKAFNSDTPGAEESGVEAYVYGVDEAFVQSFLDTARTNCPDLQPDDEEWGSERSFPWGSITYYYLFDEMMNNYLSISFSKEVGTMKFSASAHK